MIFVSFKLLIWTSLLKWYKGVCVKCIKKWALSRPLKQRIVIGSFLGNVLDSNCIELANVLVKKYPVVFAYNKKLKVGVLDPEVIVVSHTSLRHIKYLHSSQILINNVRYNNLLKKHPNQIYIQLWHGIPYKKIVFDQSDVSAAWLKSTKYLYLAGFLKEIDKWDYLCSQNAYTEERLRSCFLYDGRVIQANYPSDLALIRPVLESDVQKIKAHLQIVESKKIIFYAPTFREYCWDQEYGYRLSGILPDVFYEAYPDYIFLVRAHYLVKESLKLDHLKNVIDVQDYPYIDDLYKVSDLLITDYSSVLFEYARTEKPIICYQADLEEYQAKRGLYAVDLASFGIQITETWEAIDLESSLNKNTHLSKMFDLIECTLVEEIQKLILKHMLN